MVDCCFRVNYSIGSRLYVYSFPQAVQVSTFIDSCKQLFGKRFKYDVYRVIYKNGYFVDSIPLRYYPSRHCFLSFGSIERYSY